jgi:hypothetical protein
VEGLIQREQKPGKLSEKRAGDPTDRQFRFNYEKLKM